MKKSDNFADKHRKVGKYIPNTAIKIFDGSVLNDLHIEAIIVSAALYEDEIVHHIAANNKNIKLILPCAIP